MKNKNIIIVLALLTGIVTGLVLMAQVAGDLVVAGNNMNPGMPGDAQMPGDGAPGSGAGEPGIAPGPIAPWPFLGYNPTSPGCDNWNDQHAPPYRICSTAYNATPGANGQLPGDGAAGSGAGSGGIAPGPKLSYNATPGANGQLPGDGAPGSGAGAGGIAPGPKV
jgi:hypothetical protein